MSGRTTSDRKWIVDGDPFYEQEGEELFATLAEAVAVLRRIGGAVMIVADREEVAPEMYETTRYVFKWTSYAPARRMPQEQAVVGEPELPEAA